MLEVIESILNDKIDGLFNSDDSEAYLLENFGIDLNVYEEIDE